MRKGKNREAESWFSEAATFHRILGNRVGELASLSNAAICLKNQMAWAAARHLLGRVLEEATSLGIEKSIAYCHLTLGIVEMKSGDASRAEQQFQIACLIFRRLSHSHSECSALLALGQAQCLLGNYRGAQGSLTEAGALATHSGFAREAALSMEFFGDLLLEQGRNQESLQKFDGALEIGRQTAPSGDVVLESLRRRAEVLVRLGQLDSSGAAIAEAQTLASQIPDPYEAAVLTRVRLEHLAAAGATRRALLRSFRESRRAIWAMDERIQRGRLLEAWSRILKSWGQRERQLEDLRRAKAWYEAAGAAGCAKRVAEELEWASRALSQESHNPKLHYGMLVAHPRTTAVIDLIERYKESRLPILVFGETGTGKELIARAVHESKGANRPWIALNCGAMPRELVESELFGSVRGAYTGAVVDRQGVFERAHGGTLFLDEIGELPLSAQTRLLRVLETGEITRVGDSQIRRVSIQLVAATHKDLQAGIREGWFRSDLYFRLEGVVLEVAPLRERPEEIEPLGRHFLGQFEQELGRTIEVDESFWRELRSQPWPGNVRQLRRAVERAVMGLRPGQMLTSSELMDSTFSNLAPAPAEPRDAERGRILRALERSGWNKSDAAKLLGLKRTTLLSIMKRSGIPYTRES